LPRMAFTRGRAARHLSPITDRAFPTGWRLSIGKKVVAPCVSGIFLVGHDQESHGAASDGVPPCAVSGLPSVWIRLQSRVANLCTGDGALERAAVDLQCGPRPRSSTSSQEERSWAHASSASFKAKLRTEPCQGSCSCSCSCSCTPGRGVEGCRPGQQEEAGGVWVAAQ
jgi:hypothetical protein